MTSTTEQKNDLATEVLTAVQPLRVGIQGYSGAFHEMASHLFFSDRELEIVPAHTFTDLVAALQAGEKMDVALMAIENTLAGSIMGNYRLLLENDIRIVGEVFLRVEQQLLTLPGVRIEELEEVHSHPVAIAQCRAFFRAYPHIRLVETVDTALSAREVRDHQWHTKGAIASELASQLYGLNILARGIETNKQNHTRFLVLRPASEVVPAPDANKVSLSFTVDHAVGSLHQVLAVLAAYNVNLTKIESAPIIGRPWEYRFFVDFVITGTTSWQQALDAIRPITHEFDLLGVYLKGTARK